MAQPALMLLRGWQQPQQLEMTQTCQCHGSLWLTHEHRYADGDASSQLAIVVCLPGPLGSLPTYLPLRTYH